MGVVKVKDKEIVIPGQLLAEGMDFVPTGDAYREDDKVYSKRLGLVEINKRVIKVIPLSGSYVPREGDTVVGVVSDILVSGWRVDLGGAYSAVLPIKDAVNEFIKRGEDLTKYFDIGDVLFAKISRVTSQMLIDLTLRDKGLTKLVGGRIIKFPPVKVPRIIGKNASMITMLKKATQCKIYVGKNGYIWIDGKPNQELLLTKVIKKIDEEAHTSGLTDRVKEFLEKETGQKLG